MNKELDNEGSNFMSIFTDHIHSMRCGYPFSGVFVCSGVGGGVPYPMMHWDRGRGLSSFWLEGLDGKDLSRRRGHTSPLLTRAAQETNRPWYSRTWTVSVQCLNPSTSKGWREVMFSLANESCDFKPLGYFWRHWNILVFQTNRGCCRRGLYLYIYCKF